MQLKQEGVMGRLMMAVAIMLAAAGTASATCKSEAASKKLAGAALTSFVNKCQSDAKQKCEAESGQRRLAGAAKDSHMKKCVADAVGE
jgi:hypothetical protein